VRVTVVDGAVAVVAPPPPVVAVGDGVGTVTVTTVVALGEEDPQAARTGMSARRAQAERVGFITKA
jgi:hypothetical protein